MYGQNRESSMDGLRVKFLRKIVGDDKKLTSKSKIDLARLPPCHSALKPHLQRLNHRVALYKRSDESILFNGVGFEDAVSSPEHDPIAHPAQVVEAGLSSEADEGAAVRVRAVAARIDRYVPVGPAEREVARLDLGPACVVI
ncbi:hypothetical protein NP493_156g06018 [Ridgeia piscesae]|uniref:Uncharacterized protein n=1 Tax=Ridgeia piscesae TaxID=27915 RepID=A0AAD9P410_RIDPI|nr:hypothetical protein NP493_156g06018 [Ridgeia piscesae]